MDELEFRRLLERFPIVRFRDYHIDTDASKQSTSQSLATEEVKQWKEQWSKGRKPEPESQSMQRGGAFWGKVREATEKKVLKEKLLALCTQGGVQYDPNEEIMMAARNINERQAYSSGAGTSNRAPSSAYASSSSSSSMANRITRMEEDLDHIQHFQAYQAKQNQAIAEMLRTMALHHGMNMDKFPTFPSYIPPRKKGVLDDDDDDDDEEEEEDEDEDEE